MQNFNHILVFKTNIQTDKDKSLIKNILDDHAEIEQWSVDTDDVDCVLRIISYSLNHKQVNNLINGHGYECSELI